MTASCTFSDFFKISDLKEGDEPIVLGKIVELFPNSKVYAACPKCLRRVKAEGEQWICGRCGEIFKPIYRMFINAALEDDSGRINIIIWSPLAESLLGMDLEYAWNMAVQKMKLARGR